MASRDGLQGLVLNGVTKLDGNDIGIGAYAKVFAVKYFGTVCAAKQIHNGLVDELVSDDDAQHVRESFARECLQCSKLRHPNIVQFLGVYYPDNMNPRHLPVMVMERMTESLTNLVMKHENIPIQIKFSIVYDVAIGLCFLHSHNPPIVHRDLSPNNILLTAHHVAKISDLGVAKVIPANGRRTSLTRAPGTLDFMSPEGCMQNPIYGTPLDVFAFGGIILHTFNQEWPTPSDPIDNDSITGKPVALSEVERRRQYIDRLREDSEVMKPLVEQCLDDNPTVRPLITVICERIQVRKDFYMRESTHDLISLLQQIKQLRSDNNQLRSQLEQHQRQQLKQQQTPTVTKPMMPKPTVPAIESPQLPKGCHIEWITCADLPRRMYNLSVVVDGNMVYATPGSAPEEDTKSNVYCYDLATDKWSILSPSGHRRGVISIVDKRLCIFCGEDPKTCKMLRKVSTYNKDTKTWSRLYPETTCERFLPGVVTYGDYVILMGGQNSRSVILDSIEVLNWRKNPKWIVVSTPLPVPMWSIKPTITGEDILIVGYSTNGGRSKAAFQTRADTVTLSALNPGIVGQWLELPAAPYYETATLPNSNPPLIIGGRNDSGINSSADISMYDRSQRKWVRVDSLRSARYYVSVATINSNTIIVMGGNSKGQDIRTARVFASVTVEIGHIMQN